MGVSPEGGLAAGKGGVIDALRQVELEAMSWEAVNWCSRQATSCDGTQLVLMLLANWADPDGFLKQVRVANLVRPARQSERSIYRRLDELEKCGLLTREKVGHRSGGAPMIVGQLHLDKHYDFDAVSEAENDAGRVCQIGSASREDGVGTATGGSEVVPLVAVPIENSILNQNSTTTTFRTEPQRATETGGEAEPKGWGGEAASTVDPDGELSETRQANWREFRAAYPWHTLVDTAATRAAFLALSLTDERSAIRWAARVRDDAKRLRRNHVPDPIKGLRERAFADLDEAEVTMARKTSESGARRFIAEGTELWSICAAWHRAKHGTSPPITRKDPLGKGRSGWSFPPEAFRGTGPPGAVDAA